MSKPLTLSIGGKVQEGEIQTAAPAQPEPARLNEPVKTAEPSPMVGSPVAPSGESLAVIYEVLKRHEEMLRDLIVEVRLLYHNLSDKDKQRLEARREMTTREVGDLFAGRIRLFDEEIARLRG